MQARVYIDGQAGTTGLRIREMLASRGDLALLEIDPERRKDPSARRDLLISADLAILCLPDEAAREAAAWADESSTRLLDASSAHRVSAGWTYGLPELFSGQRERIAGAKRVSNPGCYPTGVILLLRPLIDAGLLDPNMPISIHALSGYSGGGRTMIERWQNPELGLSTLPYEVPYALEAAHKHLPEMQEYSGLSFAPHFVPAVGAFERGMRIEISLHAAAIGNAPNGARMHDVLVERYHDEPFVAVRPLGSANSNEFSFDPRGKNGSNEVELVVVPNQLGHILLVAMLDNLGKGASGAAVQNLNLMLGCPEATGLAG